jgi:hypothetical protein
MLPCPVLPCAVPVIHTHTVQTSDLSTTTTPQSAAAQPQPTVRQRSSGVPGGGMDHWIPYCRMRQPQLLLSTQAPPIIGGAERVPWNIDWIWNAKWVRYEVLLYSTERHRYRANQIGIMCLAWILSYHQDTNQDDFAEKSNRVRVSFTARHCRIRSWVFYLFFANSGYGTAALLDTI